MRLTTPSPVDSPSPSAPRPEPQNPLRSTLRGVGFEAGAAVLSPLQKKPAAQPPVIDPELDARAGLYVRGVIGVDTWDLHAFVTGLASKDEEDRFTASLRERWPATTPLHLLPFPLELGVVVHTLEPGYVVWSHSLAVDKPASEVVLRVADPRMEQHLQTYLQSPATLAHLEP